MSDMPINNGGCVLEACRLKIGNGDLGTVYYVDLAEKKSVGHAYYVPDETRLDDIALNHTDNGYPQYPQLKVHEVLKYGTKYF